MVEPRRYGFLLPSLTSQQARQSPRHQRLRVLPIVLPGGCRLYRLPQSLRLNAKRRFPVGLRKQMATGRSELSRDRLRAAEARQEARRWADGQST